METRDDVDGGLKTSDFVDLCSEKKEIKFWGGYSISTLEYLPLVAPCLVWEVHRRKEGGDGTCVVKRKNILGGTVSVH